MLLITSFSLVAFSDAASQSPLFLDTLSGAESLVSFWCDVTSLLSLVHYLARRHLLPLPCRAFWRDVTLPPLSTLSGEESPPFSLSALFDTVSPHLPSCSTL
eukprot:576790-Rhodomonas_salina.2